MEFVESVTKQGDKTFFTIYGAGGKLLAKYKDIANSDDLSTAVKKTSMKGKTFWERLVIGGNFNVLSTSPVSVDLSPQLGYKFTTRFAVGLGMNYRQTFGDSIKSRYYVSPRNTGFKLFSSYEVIKGFSPMQKLNATVRCNSQTIMHRTPGRIITLPVSEKKFPFTRKYI